jgi:hypothetical protein
VIGDMAGAEAQYRKAVALAPDCVEAQLGLAELRMPVESYLVWLDWLYQRLSPGVALEIGVFQGHSLALHRPPTVAIGVDPQPLLSQPLRTETHVFPETSDTFFAKERLASLVGRRRIDVTFIDGLHRFEQSLRDVINAEAHADPGGAIVLHDTIPLDEVTQRRERCTQFYTGDVWRTVVCLKKYRPDLEVFTIATPPSGLTIVTGLDPRSRTLSRAYDGCVRECLAVPFAAIEANLEQALNIVPAERSVVEARLPRRRWFARS